MFKKKKKVINNFFISVFKYHSESFMELIYFNWGFIGKCYKNDLGNRQMFLFFL